MTYSLIDISTNPLDSGDPKSNPKLFPQACLPPTSLVAWENPVYQVLLVFLWCRGGDQGSEKVSESLAQGHRALKVLELEWNLGISAQLLSLQRPYVTVPTLTACRKEGHTDLSLSPRDPAFTA